MAFHKISFLQKKLEEILSLFSKDQFMIKQKPRIQPHGENVVHWYGRGFELVFLPVSTTICLYQWKEKHYLALLHFQLTHI